MMGERKVTLDDVRDLIERFHRYEMSAEDFCVAFERVWNFDFEKSSISDEMFGPLDFLFDEVALFCPLPKEQWEYPMYRDEMSIRAAAERALLSMAR